MATRKTTAKSATDHATLLASGAYDAERRRARAALFADMLACFPAYEIRVVGTMGRAILVERVSNFLATVWSVSDNGGELNVAEINARQPCRSAQYVEGGRMIDGATLAYRVRQIMDGEPIDCALDLSGQLAAIRAA